MQSAISASSLLVVLLTTILASAACEHQQAAGAIETKQPLTSAKAAEKNAENLPPQLAAKARDRAEKIAEYLAGNQYNIEHVLPYEFENSERIELDIVGQDGESLFSKTLPPKALSDALTANRERRDGDLTDTIKALLGATDRQAELFLLPTHQPSHEAAACRDRCCEFGVEQDKLPSLGLKQVCFEPEDGEIRVTSVTMRHDPGQISSPRQNIWERTARIASAVGDWERFRDMLPKDGTIRVRRSSFKQDGDGKRFSDPYPLRREELMACLGTQRKARANNERMNCPEQGREIFAAGYSMGTRYPVKSCEDHCCQLLLVSSLHNSMYLEEVCYSDDDERRVEMLTFNVTP